MYKWPTWADYLHAGGLAQDYSNWGLPGGSNDFIFHSIIECISTHKITNKDIVCIMWSEPHRISDYNDEEGWTMPGNAYLYQPKERAKYLHEDKIALENRSYFRAVATILESIGCAFYFTSMERIKLKYDEVFYTQKYFKPSMAEFLGYSSAAVNTWRETLSGDRHPSPTEHLKFAQSMFDNLNIESMAELCHSANYHIFNNDEPWKRRYIYKPEKVPVHRLPSVQGMYTTGSGDLRNVNELQFKS